MLIEMEACFPKKSFAASRNSKTKFTCDTLYSYGNWLKICVRLLASPCVGCGKQSQR